jgi:adenosine kinase
VRCASDPTGDDAFGRQLEEAAKADGVTTAHLKDATTPTGTCAVLVHHHERSLIANLAAANNYKVEHLLSDAVQAIVNKAQYFYSAGFFLTVSPGTATCGPVPCAATTQPRWCDV